MAHQIRFYRGIALFTVFLLAGCGAARTTAKVVTFPVKAAWMTGKGLYLTGKGVYKVGEGVYRVGMVPVHLTQRAMNTASDILLFTTRAVDTAGQIVETTRLIKTVELQSELSALKNAKNILEVIIDVPAM
jgi:hypothetical protein